MAHYAVSITKETAWHGKQEQYDNVYHLEGPAAPPDAVGLKALCDELVAAERAVHGSSVKFIKGRVWSAGGTAIQNVTLGLFDYSSFGLQIQAPCFKELAFLIEWECERANVLGRKVYLRKFIRPGNLIASMSTEAMNGTSVIEPAPKSTLKSYADRVQTIAAPAGVNWQLRSPSGRQPRANNNGVVNDYVISREFRRN